MEHRLSFSCDYLEGAHPAILQRLCETNFAQTAGYGTDEYCQSAREKIRAACGAPNAEIHFLVGGTQTNATVIDALLRSYEGVIAADTGHISVHEAGAIEFGGHKVLTLPQENGKITASQIRALLDQYEDDANRDHTVMPGMVYLSSRRSTARSIPKRSSRPSARSAAKSACRSISTARALPTRSPVLKTT